MDQAKVIRTPPSLLGLVGMCVLLLPITLYAIFVMAPVEQRMGVVQKVFYFHMPTWYAMYLSFVMCAVFSVVYLAKRSDRSDALAVAAAEVGMLFCTIGMITGPFWARKAWGVWWTWDPRLTTALLQALIYFAYLVLRAFGGQGEVEKRFAAGLAVVGVVNLPVIHYSVQKWSGTHPTVMTGKGGGIHPDMVPALILSFVLFSALVAMLIWVRTRAEQLRQRVASLELEAAERGLLEEG